MSKRYHKLLSNNELEWSQIVLADDSQTAHTNVQQTILKQHVQQTIIKQRSTDVQKDDSQTP